VRDRLQAKYNEAFERLEDKLFNEIGDNPSREADCDERRFVAKYFQDAQGRPDRSKTKEALCFTSYASWGYQQSLREVVETVPGLAIHLTEDKAVVGWVGTLQRAIEKEFSRLEDHYKNGEFHERLSPQACYQSAQANLDLDLFLTKTLYVDKNGKTLAKGKELLGPVLLDRYDLHSRNLPDDIISKVPGLLIEEYESIAVIGWDAKSIKAEVERLKDTKRRMDEQEKREEEEARAGQESKRKARWDRQCKPYHDLVARQQQPPNPWEIQHIIGSYIVHWHGEEPKEYGDLNDPDSDLDVMRINVFPCKRCSHGLIASYWFGMFEGTMLLAKSKQELEWLREAQSKGSGRFGDISGSESDDDADDLGLGPSNRDSEEREPGGEHDKARLIRTGFETFYGSRKAVFGNNKTENKSARKPAEEKTKKLPAEDDKVKVKTEPAAGQKRTIGDMSDPWGVEAARLKRQQMMGGTSAPAKPNQDSNPNRIYFQFVAREVDGYPDVDDQNENVGHLDFDETRLGAKGQFVWPRFWGKDEPQSISIFKVAEKPEYPPDEWYMYDGRRWGGYGTW